ncbi:TetR/AcrR family transcriptional regulator (plasmid) [Arthrobacter sp. D3-18]
MAGSAPQRPQAVQQRSQETEQRILQAAVRVLGEAGVEALTTAEVSAAAGVSVGSIYRRFGNKEQLLLATQSEFLRLFEGNLYQELSGIPSKDARDPARTIAYATKVVGMSFAKNAAPLRVLLIVGLTHEDIRLQGHLASVRGGSRFGELILNHRDSLAHEDPEAAVDFAFRLIYSACSHRIMQGENLESLRRRTWPETIDELARAARAYLLCA